MLTHKTRDSRALRLVAVVAVVVSFSTTASAGIVNTVGFSWPLYDLGDLAGQDGWVTVGDGDGTAVVEERQDGVGGQFVRVDRGANSDDRWYVPVDNQPTEQYVVIEWEMMVTEAVPGPVFGPFFGIEAYDYSETGAFGVLGSFGVDSTTGDLLYQEHETGFFVETGEVAEFDQWNLYKLVLDFEADHFFAFFNEVMLGSGTFVDSYDGNDLNEFTDADIAALAAYEDPLSQAGVATAYFDEFRVSAVADAFPTLVWDDPGDGQWGSEGGWGDSGVPDEAVDVVVPGDSVTVAGDANVHGLTVEGDARIVVAPDATFDVIEHLDVAAGTLEVEGALVAHSVEIETGALELGAAGSLEVEEELVFGEETAFAVGLEGENHGMVTAGGTIVPAGTLEVEASGPLDEVGDSRRPILSVIGDGTIEGTFESMPETGDHVGFGTFFQGTHVSEDQTELSIDVFQAAHGDVDGDRVVGTEDIVVIKTSDHGFAKPGPATWLDGDIIGHGLDTPPDGIVDLWDIFAIKRAGLYGEGQYAPDAPGGNLLSASAVPEPGTFVLLAIALVSLLVWRRR